MRLYGHVERMDKGRTPVKAKRFAVEGSKSKPKQDVKEVRKTDVLVRG